MFWHQGIFGSVASINLPSAIGERLAKSAN
jgi:hypothetical protein